MTAHPITQRTILLACLVGVLLYGYYEARAWFGRRRG